MKIIKQTGTINTTVKLNRDIDYIVIHYTASTTAKKGTAKAIAKMFTNSTYKASADYIIDKDTIIQYNPDLNNRYTWAVGGEKYTTMSTSEGGKYYGKCMNNNSISIEMCSAKKNTKSVSVTDTDWYIPAKVKRKAIKLTRRLCKKYNIPYNHVIMHHHVTGKWCPQPWVYNESRLKQWYKFKRQLKSPIS